MTSQNPRSSHDATDPSRWIHDHGDALFRYAWLRVGNHDLAEDLVQQTFLGGIASLGGFSRRASERTWLIGILKHKITDHMRRVAREQPFADLDVDVEVLEDSFSRSGKWKNPRSESYSSPVAALETREFWDAFVRALSTLPPLQAYAFSLREVDGLSGSEICKILEISETNLWTLLHRARLRLRKALDDREQSP